MAQGPLPLQAAGTSRGRRGLGGGRQDSRDNKVSKVWNGLPRRRACTLTVRVTPGGAGTVRVAETVPADAWAEVAGPSAGVGAWIVTVAALVSHGHGLVVVVGNTCLQPRLQPSEGGQPLLTDNFLDALSPQGDGEAESKGDEEEDKPKQPPHDVPPSPSPPRRLVLELHDVDRRKQQDWRRCYGHPSKPVNGAVEVFHPLFPVEGADRGHLLEETLDDLNVVFRVLVDDLEKLFGGFAKGHILVLIQFGDQLSMSPQVHADILELLHIAESCTHKRELRFFVHLLLNFTQFFGVVLKKPEDDIHD
mmetsp:Transcript_3967/g.9409  ORF Transcript_3967/g.9409 Transcript_3967/m.9409 type:complete len:306 (+) Transcript_3967:1029-1946(+)